MEHIICGDTSIAGPLNNLRSKVEELCNVNPSGKKTKLRSQFEVCSYSNGMPSILHSILL